jgi:hypothetical protein
LRYSQGLIRRIFVAKVTSNWQLAASKIKGEEMTGFRVETRPKRDFDRSVTVRSKWGWAFVFNKSGTPGWGWARNARLSPESRVIADIARDRKPGGSNVICRHFGSSWDGFRAKIKAKSRHTTRRHL